MNQRKKAAEADDDDSKLFENLDRHRKLDNAGSEHVDMYDEDERLRQWALAGFSALFGFLIYCFYIKN